jgi:hypothetical protein
MSEATRAWFAAYVAELIADLDARTKAAEPPPSYTCPRCGRVSYHPRDIAEKYCGACHQFECL